MKCKCDTCKFLYLDNGKEWPLDHEGTEVDCILEMWDYFQQDVKCPQYIECSRICENYKGD